MQIDWSNIKMFDPFAQVLFQSSILSDVVPLHSHVFFEILFCTGGNVNYILDDKRYRIQRGDIILIPPGVGHRPLFLEELQAPYERYVLWISPIFMQLQREMMPEIDHVLRYCAARESFLLRTTPATWKGFELAFAGMYQESRQQKFCWEQAVRLNACVILLHLSRMCHEISVTTAKEERGSFLDDVLNYIDAHRSEKITLKDTAAHFMVSPSTISHLFREKNGIPFYRYVVQRRLIMSKNKILAGDPLQRVWEECGFSDYSSFYRLFKKEYGLSPKMFRKQNEKNQI